MEGYCLKCRTKREMKNASSVTLKNGRPATEGTCDPDTDICDAGTLPPDDADPAWQPVA